MKNPYDCSTCGNDDCRGCGESAYENGYQAGMQDSEIYKVLKKLLAQYLFEGVTADSQLIQDVNKALAKAEGNDGYSRISY